MAGLDLVAIVRRRRAWWHGVVFDLSVGLSVVVQRSHEA